MDALVSTTSELVGFGALIAMLVNSGKSFGIVKDGQAKVWVTGLNILLMLGVYFGGILDLNIMSVDSAAGTLAELAGVAFALVAQLGGSSLTHVVLRGAPIVGASHSE
tara:strand:- start:49 stop:372 length:324 start_codon:yes stop_codon:yes gene_type:complete